MYRQIGIVILLLLPVTMSAAPALAANEGQEDLDKATATKLSAKSIADLSKVIDLTESALKKGLDESGTAFAKKLLVSAYIQRAQTTIENFFVNLTSADEFHQRRKFARDDLDKAVKLDPKQPQAYLMLAQLNLLPGGEGVKAARDALDKALNLDPKLPQAYLMLAQLNLLPGGEGVKAARDALDKAIALDTDDVLTRAKALTLRANLQEDPEKKLADFNEAVRLVPDNATIILARGLALADMNKFEPALADLDKAIDLEPGKVPAYEAKAVVLAQMKKYDEALAVLERAQQIDPKSAALLLQRARVHSAQGKPDAALEDLDKALALKPDDVELLLLRAGVYQELGKKEKALADVDQVLKLRPGLIVAIRSRALLLAEDERFDEAIAELEKLRQNDPTDLLTLLQLGSLYSVSKKSEKAVEVYSAFLAAEPEQWQALRGRGDAYLNLGKQADAVADYEKAMILQLKEPGLLNNLAWVLATSPDDKLRDGKRAVRLATEACEATEYKLDYILSTLAAAYAETGDFDSAVKWAAKAVELGGKEHGEEIKKELESYKEKKPWRELLSEKKAEEK